MYTLQKYAGCTSRRSLSMCIVACSCVCFSHEVPVTAAAIMPRSMTLCCLQWLSSLKDNCCACPSCFLLGLFSSFFVCEKPRRLKICCFTDSVIKMADGFLIGRRCLLLILWRAERERETIIKIYFSLRESI